MDSLSRYSDATVEHLRSPRNPGRLDDPDGEAQAMNPACGDEAPVLTLRVSQGRIAAARFLAHGCPATLAAGSALTVRLAGLDAAGVAALTPEELDRDLGGLPEGRFHAVELACRVARDAIARAAAAERGRPCRG